METAWVRSDAPNFSRIFWTCIFTVPLAVPSLSLFYRVDVGFVKRAFASGAGPKRARQKLAPVAQAFGVDAVAEARRKMPLARSRQAGLVG